MIKKSKINIHILLFILIFLFSSTVAVFGGQTVEYTTNGAASQYVAGSVLVLYGKVEDGGTAVPNTSVTVDIKDSSSTPKVIYYGQLKTDSKGYFKTNFTIPTGVTGSMNVKISTIEGEKVSASYSLNSSGSLKFTGYVPSGYRESESVITIPASTSKLGLVFNSNVNYFNNKNNNLDLASLGINERNRDCVELFERNSQGNYVLVSSSLQMASTDATGDDKVNGITYISGVSADDKKNERKDILYVVPKDGLKAGTTYKVIIDKDLSANNSSTLGSDVVVFFQTASIGSGSGSSDSTAVDNPSSVPTVKAESIGKITAGNNTSSLAVDSVKAEDILRNDNKTALSIDLSNLRDKNETRVNVTLPAKVLTIAKTENKPIILNYGEFIMVIPPASLPTDKELVLEAKEVGTPSDEREPDNINGLKKFEFSAKDTGGNVVTFNSNLNLEFDIPDNTINPERLCVYFIDDKTGEWIYAGGRIVNGKLTFSPRHYSTYAIAESVKTFTDISNHWAKNSIETMVARQISNGVSESLFAPNKNITRAEFAVLISRVLGLDSTEAKNSFGDISENAWYKNDVNKVAAANIVTGDKGKFRPNENISRQEMAVMLARAYSYIGTTDITTIDITYIDKSNIPDWAYNSVTQISSLKMMSGYPDGSFGGGKNSTRAEATKTLKAFMDTLKL